MKTLIKVEMRLYATLRRYAPSLKLGEALELNLKEGTTLESLFKKIKIPKEEVKTVLINGRARNHSYILLKGDRVAIFPAVAGG